MASSETGDDDGGTNRANKIVTDNERSGGVPRSDAESDSLSP